MISPQDSEYQNWPKEARFRYHERLAVLGCAGAPTLAQDKLGRQDAKRWFNEALKSGNLLDP